MSQRDLLLTDLLDEYHDSIASQIGDDFEVQDVRFFLQEDSDVEAVFMVQGRNTSFFKITVLTGGDLQTIKLC